MPVAHYDPLYLIIMGVAMIVSHVVGLTLRSKMAKYSRMPLPVAGADVATQMLADHGLGSVQVISVAGQLTDHYNPAAKTVNLSEPVYAINSVAAAAVAAHECGHAVQDATGFPMLRLRSRLVPLVQFGSNLAPWIIMIGIGLAAGGNSPTVLLIGILLFATSTVFALVTLPVEFDASRRALAWLEKSGIATGLSHNQAKDALRWAAMTYVVAALASIGQLLYYVMLFLNARGRRE
jgi:Zn-dependent membrane protease YugP